jgi:hypothetical protein
VEGGTERTAAEPERIGVRVIVRQIQAAPLQLAISLRRNIEGVGDRSQMRKRFRGSVYESPAPKADANSRSLTIVQGQCAGRRVARGLCGLLRQAAVSYSHDALRQDLLRVRVAWEGAQSSRDRDAIYGYLT